jgi:hypothetical protein
MARCDLCVSEQDELLKMILFNVLSALYLRIYCGEDAPAVVVPPQQDIGMSMLYTLRFT